MFGVGIDARPALSERVGGQGWDFHFQGVFALSDRRWEIKKFLTKLR